MQCFDFYAILYRAYKAEVENIKDLYEHHVYPYASGIVDSYLDIIQEDEIDKVLFRGEVVDANRMFIDNDIDYILNKFPFPYIDYNLKERLNPSGEIKL